MSKAEESRAQQRSGSVRRAGLLPVKVPRTIARKLILFGFKRHVCGMCITPLTLTSSSDYVVIGGLERSLKK
jgi:hypothetical protein